MRIGNKKPHGAAMKPALKSIMLGFAFGLLVLPIGLFIGLQVFPPLANLLLFPGLIFSHLSGIIFGYATSIQVVYFFIANGVGWAAVFFAVSRGRQWWHAKKSAKRK